MKTTKVIRAAALSAFALVAMSAAARAEGDATFAALQRAWAGEVQARAAYLAYAERADLEGLPGTAFLFRVVAVAESVHAANHARFIEEMGGRVEPRAGAVDVKDTRTNLKAAIDAELDEYGRVYRALAARARAEHCYGPLWTFNDSRSAEASHATVFGVEYDRLMRAQASLQLIASADPTAWPTPEAPGEAVEYGVCEGCGTVTFGAVDHCACCGFNATHIVVRAWQP